MTVLHFALFFVAPVAGAAAPAVSASGHEAGCFQQQQQCQHRCLCVCPGSGDRHIKTSRCLPQPALPLPQLRAADRCADQRGLSTMLQRAQDRMAQRGRHWQVSVLHGRDLGGGGAAPGTWTRLMTADLM